MLLQRPLQVRRILVDQIVQLQNVTLLHRFIRTARILQPGIEKNIRQLARSQQQAELLVGHRRSAQLFDPDACAGFILIVYRQPLRCPAQSLIHKGKLSIPLHRIGEAD
ncbi:hypothetical protein D3C73_1133310 [compost metagenome]